MSEKVFTGFNPEEEKVVDHNSDQYYEEIQATHDEEEEAFSAEGWQVLDCFRPFYLYSAKSPEGSIISVAETATKSPSSGFNWWWIDGEILPPDGMYYSFSTFIVKDGEWVKFEK